MKVKTFTLSFVNEECGFATDELDDFVADKKIFDVRDHFFVHEGWPYWAILLTYEELSPEKTMSAPFTPSQQRLFDALKAWRLSRAKASAWQVQAQTSRRRSRLLRPGYGEEARQKAWRVQAKAKAAPLPWAWPDLARWARRAWP